MSDLIDHQLLNSTVATSQQPQDSFSNFPADSLANEALPIPSYREFDEIISDMSDAAIAAASQRLPIDDHAGPPVHGRQMNIHNLADTRIDRPRQLDPSFSRGLFRNPFVTSTTPSLSAVSGSPEVLYRSPYSPWPPVHDLSPATTFHSDQVQSPSGTAAPPGENNTASGPFTLADLKYPSAEAAERASNAGTARWVPRPDSTRPEKDRPHTWSKYVVQIMNAMIDFSQTKDNERMIESVQKKICGSEGSIARKNLEIAAYRYVAAMVSFSNEGPRYQTQTPKFRDDARERQGEGAFRLHCDTLDKAIRVWKVFANKALNTYDKKCDVLTREVVDDIPGMIHQIEVQQKSNNNRPSALKKRKKAKVRLEEENNVEDEAVEDNEQTEEPNQAQGHEHIQEHEVDQEARPNTDLAVSQNSRKRPIEEVDGVEAEDATQYDARSILRVPNGFLRGRSETSSISRVSPSSTPVSTQGTTFQGQTEYAFPARSESILKSQNEESNTGLRLQPSLSNAARSHPHRTMQRAQFPSFGEAGNTSLQELPGSATTSIFSHAPVDFDESFHLAASWEILPDREQNPDLPSNQVHGEQSQDILSTGGDVGNEMFWAEFSYPPYPHEPYVFDWYPRS